jgi:urease accessory protein
VPRVRRPAARARTATSAPTLLALMWLASPALPIGGFSYSEGLEAAVDAGLVSHEAAARDWLLDQLVLGLACSELAVVARAFAAWRRHDTERARELNDWMLATRETAEQRLQAEQMGRSLAAWLAQRQADAAQGGSAGDGHTRAAVAALLAFTPAPTYPVAFALAAACTACSAREAVLAAGFGWAENMVQAAVRAVPLGQSAGQRILGALVDALPAAVDHALALGDGDRLASLPGLAILGARHETQYSRLFRS